MKVRVFQQCPQVNLLKAFCVLVLAVSLVVVVMTYTTYLNQTLTSIDMYRAILADQQRDLQFQRKAFWVNSEGIHFLMSNNEEDYDDSREANVDFTRTNETQERRLPHGIIIGASKCGTRALLEYLSLNPNIVAAKHEVNFFNNSTNYARGLAWYREQMPPTYSSQITIEKSPDYFECPSCPTRVRAMNSSIRLIALLRDPVQRLISQYMQFVDKFKLAEKTIDPFEQWVADSRTGGINHRIPSVNVGIYADHIRRWLKSFPASQILVIDSDRFSRNPLEDMSRIEQFLGLQPYLGTDDIFFNETKGFHCLRVRATGKTRCLGSSKGRPHVNVDNRITSMLYDFYNPHNERLRKLLGQGFSWL